MSRTDDLDVGARSVHIGPRDHSTDRYGVTARATGDGDRNPIDLTEAYLEWRPYPSSPLRWKTRAGAFYAPISLENRAVGWDSLYSISASAINTWMGEEFSFGARVELPLEITAIAQYMPGDTAVGASADGRGFIIVDLESWFV